MWKIFHLFFMIQLQPFYVLAFTFIVLLYSPGAEY